jgi:hypothetical protein
MAPKRDNNQYHKNQHYDDIKSHHYILSFAPKDKDDHRSILSFDRPAEFVKAF